MDVKQQTAVAITGQSSRQTLHGKWRFILLLSIAELLAMGTWFSASVVVPALSEIWGLGNAAQAWLTMSVQAGFVAGSIAAALFNLPDRIPSRWLFSSTAFLAAISTLLIPVAGQKFFLVIFLRFLTGLFLTGVYPVGMKIMATWTKEDRGLGIGILVGALTLGTAFPHLLNLAAGADNWQFVLLVGGLLAVAGALIALLFLREGPYNNPNPQFNWRYSAEVLRNRPLRLVILGYLGHMWELFAMWAWLAVFLMASFESNGITAFWASITTFAAISAGGLGSLLAGKLADRYGRTTVTIISLAVSGFCAMLIGFFFKGNPVVLAAISLVWGFSVVADSAQYSAAVSELCKKEYTGTAITIQTSLGFLLTMVTIRLIPTLRSSVGWNWAFAFLALGPVVGIWSMLRLRHSPSASRLASGNR